MRKLLFLLVICNSYYSNAQTTSNKATTKTGSTNLFDVFNNLGAPDFLNPSNLTKIDESDSWDLGTEWFSHDDFDETVVFNSELSSVSDDTDYKIRIGKGGQLYSIKMPESGLGELIPPQQNIAISPWNDAIFMSTYIWKDIHNEDEVGKWGKGQVHASGMYIKPELDALNTKPFYSPLLGEKYESESRTYSVINLVTIPSASINRADMLQYLNYRDVGSGVLEITYYVYNYHSYTCTGGSTPWAGLRHSKLPNTIRGTTDNGFEDFEGGFYNIKDAGNGWMAQTEDSSNSDSWTIGFVHGKDDYYDAERQKYTLGEQSVQFAPTIIQSLFGGNTVRDFQIINLSNRLDLNPGEGFFRRVYMVFGKLSNVAAKCASLSENTDYGELEFTKDSSLKTPLYKTTISDQTILTTEIPDTSSLPLGSIYSTPVKGTVPLFQLRNRATGAYNLSTDQYAICNKEPFVNPLDPTEERYDFFENRHIYQIYDETTEWVSLLGYVLPNLTPTNEDPLLSSILGDAIKFSKGEKNDADKLVLASIESLSNTNLSLAKVIIYPNPSVNTVTIESPYNILKIKIYNTVGKMVKQIEEDGKKIKLNIQNLSSGIYILNLTLENNKTVNRKIIIKNG